MWRYLEQASFPLSEAEYMQKLDAIAYCLTLWGVVETVKRGVEAARGYPGYTGGGNAKAISIPLGFDLDGGSTKEQSRAR
jgi:Domain of unknown function (DUF3067)